MPVSTLTEKFAENLSESLVAVLAARYPSVTPHLQATSAWQLLVATMLAAQCTDARVNAVTPHLFARWPGPEDLAKADLADLERVIHSTGFYRAKARNLIKTAVRVTTVYMGRVPETMEDLVTLSGVARKTANVVLFGAFGKNVGLAVDTHVGRIARRLGLTRSHDPTVVERDLCTLFPQELWGRINHWLVSFGREVCHSRKPLCGQCAMSRECLRVGV